MNSRISQLESERIIHTLGDGVPVPDYIMDYSSDVNITLLNTVKDHLGKVNRGLTVARFVKGDYGSGKSHFLNLVREIALRDNFIVSYFDLRAREGFDMIERIFSKLIKSLSVHDKRNGDSESTVLDHIIRKWATNFQNIDEEIRKMPLDATYMDFINVMILYCKVVSKQVPKLDQGVNLIELLNRWFHADSLKANERRKLNTFNNITVRNARDILNQLSVFFKSIGYSGWVILIDEQEIIPTLMSPQKRNLSNENLKVIIDTQPTTKYRYYLFATTPEFFTDATNGINAYPALRQRVQDILEVHPLSEKEMVEAGKKIKEIYCIAYPDFDRGLLPESTIRHCSNFMDRTYSKISPKARIFIQSYIKLLNRLRDGGVKEAKSEFQSITGLIWDELERKTKDAYSKK